MLPHHYHVTDEVFVSWIIWHQDLQLTVVVAILLIFSERVVECLGRSPFLSPIIILLITRIFLIQSDHDLYKVGGSLWQHFAFNNKQPMVVFLRGGQPALYDGELSYT